MDTSSHVGRLTCSVPLPVVRARPCLSPVAMTYVKPFAPLIILSGCEHFRPCNRVGLGLDLGLSTGTPQGGPSPGSLPSESVLIPLSRPILVLPGLRFPR